MMQVKTQIGQDDGRRLEIVLKEYGFKSRFELAKALLMVFIKANDPRGDEILCENFKDIFIQEAETKIKHN